MTRKWIDEPDSAWEPLGGKLPQFYLGKHPSGTFVAMQVSLMLETLIERAAVWNAETCRIEWDPGNANALCWIEDGNQILVLEEVFIPDHHHPAVFATPLQREYVHFLRRFSWPKREHISSIEVTFPTGWLVDIVPSPTEALACFVWEDQHEAGIEFVSWEDGHLRQLPDSGYFGRSNFIQGPVFSPDGRFVALSYGEGTWWSDEPDVPSLGGLFKVGWVVVGETASGTYREIEVTASVAEGWLPDDPDDIKNELPSCPVFIDNEAFRIMLPTGEERRFSTRIHKKKSDREV